MQRKSSEMGLNRTGIRTSPVHGKKEIEGAEKALPSSPGDASGIWKVRQELARESEGLGSVPPPNLKGLAKAAADLLKGGRATVFIDKLGQRAGFERVGVRLYEAALSKLDVFGTWDGGPSREQLEKIRRDELSHFALVKSTIEKLGGDPTALTPAANLQANLSEGVPKVLVDPRVNLLQSLEGLLTAELVDNASWELLIQLARELGHREIAEDFQRALDVEQEHLALVRSWLAAGTRLEATVGQEAAGAPA
ncbi:ferritin-like domain-containing protein [Vitiosangium sp. GDMCC 1.1324]|uniref:ferritin-like domain-containing protein n=1 Tax=Vitiosangium sp. (strain GDMCC 1.1324) TaxID=2138576 RepID=UPI000D3ACEC3|nr:ferritin-like domain-containing protein [Vitiosangium sp. GDMCC 1.1324]PTL79932.1 ferritin [Vitiosangium sp. GDMCC 1.1324]